MKTWSGGNETLSTWLSSCQIQKRKASPGMKDQKGIYTATYTALLPGTGLKAQLQMSGWLTL